MNLKTKTTETAKLLQSIKDNLSSLEELLETVQEFREDIVYRFYHQSFKVHGFQSFTQEMVAKLQSLAPHLPLNTWFLDIVRQGTGHEFDMSDNKNWTAITRPMVEAFLHAHYLLEMACKYGKELASPPQCIPTGWAAVLYLYNLR
jgi:hypothetical protein